MFSSGGGCVEALVFVAGVLSSDLRWAEVSPSSIECLVAPHSFEGPPVADRAQK
jgi:hypothetical protein